MNSMASSWVGVPIGHLFSVVRSVQVYCTSAYGGSMAERYVRPGWFTRHVFNPAVAALTRMGVSVWGSRILAVRGRKTGEWRTTPVNLLVHNGERCLVAPRGTTQWVR